MAPIPQDNLTAILYGVNDLRLIWSVSIPTLLLSLTAEHARSNFFKNIGPGVTQLHIDSHSRLFSCGADGSMKVRQLPDRETLFNNHHH